MIIVWYPTTKEDTKFKNLVIVGGAPRCTSLSNRLYKGTKQTQTIIHLFLHSEPCKNMTKKKNI